MQGSFGGSHALLARWRSLSIAISLLFLFVGVPSKANLSYKTKAKIDAGCSLRLALTAKDINRLRKSVSKKHFPRKKVWTFWWYAKYVNHLVGEAIRARCSDLESCSEKDIEEATLEGLKAADEFIELKRRVQEGFPKKSQKRAFEFYANNTAAMVTETIHKQCPPGQECTEDDIIKAIEDGLKVAWDYITASRQLRNSSLGYGGAGIGSVALLSTGLVWLGVPAAIMGALGYAISMMAGPRIMASMSAYWNIRLGQDTLNAWRRGNIDTLMATSAVSRRMDRTYDFMMAHVSPPQRDASYRNAYVDVGTRLPMQMAAGHLESFFTNKTEHSWKLAAEAIAACLVSTRNNFPDVFTRMAEGEETLTLENMKGPIVPFFPLTAPKLTLGLSKSEAKKHIGPSFWKLLVEQTVRNIQAKESVDFGMGEVRSRHAKLLAEMFDEVLDEAEVTAIFDEIYQGGDGDSNFAPWVTN